MIVRYETNLPLQIWISVSSPPEGIVIVLTASKILDILVECSIAALLANLAFGIFGIRIDYCHSAASFDYHQTKLLLICFVLKLRANKTVVLF